MDREQPAPPAWPNQVRWTGAELILVVLVAPAVWGWFCNELLHASGLFERVYGPQAVAVLRHPSPQSLPAAATVAAPCTLPPPGAPAVAVLTCTISAAGTTTLPAVREIWFFRTSLWTGDLAFLLQVATVLLVLRWLSDTSPAELGLTFQKAGRNIALGLGLALVVTPVVTGLNVLVISLWKVLHSTGIHEHPFTRLGQQSLLPVEWVLLILAAVVVAPIWEELVFRGLLQPWFASQPHGGALALAFAFLLSLLACSEQIWSALPAGVVPTLLESLPVLGLLLLVPVSALLEKLSPRPVGPALFGTAVLFGWVHARVWPTPLPLFFLGLVLGWLAYRTRSLVASITLHAAFNGAACVLLVLQSLRKG